MQFVKGPDFPTGALILGRQGIMDAYRSGRGSIKMRARAEIVEGRGGDEIVVTELPYQASPKAIVQRIAELVNARELEGIRDIRDLSAGDDTKLVDRPEARRQRQRRAQQPVQAHAAADQLRGQHGGPGGRGPPDPQPGPGAAGLRRPPGGGHPPAFRVPLEKGPGPGPHRRGPDQGPRHDRRHHRGHQGVRGPGDRDRRPAGGAVRVQRHPGHPHRRTCACRS